MWWTSQAGEVERGAHLGVTHVERTPVPAETKQLAVRTEKERTGRGWPLFSAPWPEAAETSRARPHPFTLLRAG
jgi:hypothetical protein